MRMDIEHEGAGRAQLPLPAGKGPARDDARKRGDVLLRIAPADAERMQLHDLAREILIQPALAVLARARIRSERLLVIEEEQHRRMLLDSFEHVGKTPEHVRPDRLAFERTGP